MHGPAAKALSILALTLALAGSVQAAEAQQFNLICSGTTSGVVDPREPRQMDAPRQRWIHSYRVDLNAKRYCQDACETLQALAEGEPGQVVFVDTVSLIDLATRERHSAVLDRATRKYSASDTVQDLTWGYYKTSVLTTGTCEAGPFSGFPAP
jgi:hypothetical protein